MTIEFESWRREMAARAELVRPLAERAATVARTRPRAAAEAELLRARGVPESRIGPVADGAPAAPRP